MYYRARYYDPTTGRFLHKDPIGFAGGTVNLYQYAAGNVVNGNDPFGLIDPWWQLRGKLAGGAALALINLFGNDPFGAKCYCGTDFNSDQRAVLQLIGAGGSFGNALILSQATGSAAPIYAVGFAFYAGVQAGAAFNQAWCYASGGQSSLGSWIYDVTHEGG